MNLFSLTTYTSPNGCYAGSRDWANRHAAKNAHLIGTFEGTHKERVVVDLLVVPYGHSKSKYAVEKRWQYVERPELGTYGKGCYLYLTD